MADEPNLIELTASVVAAYVGRNNIAPGDLPNLIRTVYRAWDAGKPAPEAQPVTLLTKSEIRKSVTPDGIRSFEDGRTYKSLKRHLGTKGLTPAEYRAKWGLPAEYKMVSEIYSKSRSELAKALGLGRKRATAAPAQAKPPESPPAAAMAKKPAIARKPRTAKAPSIPKPQQRSPK